MRKSTSVAFFSIVATLLILAVLVMGCSQFILLRRYFETERLEMLDEVGDVTEKDAGIYYMEAMRHPDDGQMDVLVGKVALIEEAANVSLLFTDTEGKVLITSDVDIIHAESIPQKTLERVQKAQEKGELYHTTGTLEHALSEKCYLSGRMLWTRNGQLVGYLFVCSPSARMSDFVEDMLSKFLLSACLMLLSACVMTTILMRRITEPIHKISEAAQRFGGGDMSVRVEGVEGDDEIAALAISFNTMAANLQEIDRSRAQFMGNIAHELRTPMTTIKGFVDGILDGTIPEELQKHYLKLVSQETGRLARLVQNMLDLSKMESGEYRVNARMFNIWETITSVALSAEQRINDGRIEIEGLTMDRLLVYADPDLVHQVVYNLLDNAIKFTPEGGVIRFHAEKLGPQVEVTVWNEGQGISEEALPFVFERFYKEDQSRGLHARGAGLGLHISKVLVNLSGGKIRVESKQGEWCQFVFTLPAEVPNQNDMLKIPDETGLTS